MEQGSPAIDAGDNVICQAPPPEGLGGVDQRGFPRSRPGDPICDIGAFEFVNLTLSPTLLNFGAEVLNQETAAQTVSVTNNQTTNVTLTQSIAGTNPRRLHRDREHLRHDAWLSGKLQHLDSLPAERY